MHSDAESRGGRSPEETFAILGHETRLAILYELWDAQDPTAPKREALSFAELRKRVGMRDGSQFNYHLTQLVGPFVRQTDDGYELRRTGGQIISTMLAGALTDEVVLDTEPIDDPCPLCGGQVVLDHGTDRSPDLLLVRCTACEGAWKHPELGSGVLRAIPLLLPAGVRERSLAEMYRVQTTWVKYRIMLLIEGVCPRCSGTVTATPLICEDHTVGDGQVCPHCDRIFEILFRRVCDVCQNSFHMPTGRHILVHPTVAAFYHDHDFEVYGHNWHRVEMETIADQTVVSEDPLAIEVTVVIDDDDLNVTLDGAGAVIDVQT
ncbi:DUF7351 domain-containing protein [Halorussus salinisoli]|uniref:DUF7351 domain-containing protein n=1 Tax=Halorussus salinisoli TaxID=2558242 RepID=UPI0010C23903|nr:ArsR family transcriptional regulator [Halorussus salinisoli]